MSQKRQQEEGKGGLEGDCSEDKRRRLKDVILEVMMRQNIQRLLEPALEPILRRVVKEEVELALRKHMPSMKWICDKETHSLKARSLCLKFLNKLSLPVFTSARIEGDESPALRIGLVEPVTGQIIKSGPESSAKVEIVVLEGDFGGDEHGNWTPADLKNNIVRERHGRKPLLNGDVFIVLNEGVGSVGEISFMDNSSWTRSRKFKLGARLVDSFSGVEVKEAITESFVVRDHRGELYRKHHPPSLSDEVWRLEKIGKDGAFHKRLTRAKISTVRDFLTLFFVDPAKLRHILGTGMSSKMWDIAVGHAQSCVLDKKLHVHCPISFQNRCGVVFNVVGQVMGVLRDSQYIPVNKLSESELAEAQKLVVAALTDHWDEVISYDDDISLFRSVSSLNNHTFYSSSSSAPSVSSWTQPSPQKISRLVHMQPNVSSTGTLPPMQNPAGNMSSLGEYAIHNLENMDPRYNQMMLSPFQGGDSSTCGVESVTQLLSDDYDLRFFDASFSSQTVGLYPQADLQSVVDGFKSGPSTFPGTGDKAQMRWTKLFSIFKWFVIRRIVTKKTQVGELQRRNYYNR